MKWFFNASVSLFTLAVLAVGIGSFVLVSHGCGPVTPGPTTQPVVNNVATYQLELEAVYAVALAVLPPQDQAEASIAYNLAQDALTAYGKGSIDAPTLIADIKTAIAAITGKSPAAATVMHRMEAKRAMLSR
jgi:hypothetical protein